MLLRVILASLISCCPVFTRAQDNAQITGRVTTSDGKPAENISVALKNTGRGVLTDEKGRYRLSEVEPGAYTIRVAGIGIESQERPVTLAAGEIHRLDFSLNASAARLGEVTVTSNAGKYQAEQPSASLRLDQPLVEIPQNIQVITSATLEDQQVISMSDNLIRNVSGAARIEHWGDLFAKINMRGSRVQAFRNGFNVVNSSWGPLTEDMSFVDHIEVVKGPAGFMIANGDPSGLYNVVTKKPTGNTQGKADFTLGSYDLYRATLDLDGKLSSNGKALYRLNLAGQHKYAHRPYEHNHRYTVAPVVSYQFGKNTKLTAEYTLQHANMTDLGSFYVFSPEGYATRPVDFTAMAPGLEPTKINDHSVFLNLQHAISSNWKLTAQAAYFNYQQNGSDIWPVSVDADGKMIREVYIWDAQSDMTLGQVFINGDVTTGAVRHRILGGLDIGRKEYEADWAQSHLLDTAGAEFDPFNPDYGAPANGYPSFDRSSALEARAVAGGGLIDQRYTGIYLQDELGFLDNRLRVTLAGRYTYVSQSQYGGEARTARHFTPRLGVSVSVDENTSVYALYDQAFIPQTGVLADGGEVKPITGNNTELGIKKDWFDSWSTTLSFYRILKKNELTTDPDSPPNSGLSVVLGEKRAQGIEFDLRGEITRGLNLIANYAYTDSEVTEVTPGVTSISEGDLIPGFSTHTLNAWLNYRLQTGPLRGAGISAGFTNLIGRATDNWGDTDVRLPDYFRLDGGLFWQKNRINLTLNVFNILDEYLYSGSYYNQLEAYYWQTEPPRNYRLSIGYSF